MSATSRLIVLFLALAVSQVSQAGAGYYFYLTNNMSQGWFGGGEKAYPRVTIHAAGGSTCWYLNSIADWDQYAVPGDSEKPLYTEAKDSTGCFFETSSVEIAMYVQADADSAWVQIGDKAMLWNELNKENGFYINPGLPYTLPLTSLCGLSIQNTFLPATNLNQVKVSGTPKLEGCTDAHTTSKASLQSHATVNGVGVAPLAPPVGIKSFNLKVGQTRKVRLPELDPSSVWELDGGTCQGDKAIKSDLKRNYTKRRVLPETVNVIGTAVGQRVCSLTAYHYPERSVVTQEKIIFNIK
jgi:hypothetical protein